MKPFITDAFQAGKFSLPFQVEGMPPDKLKSTFEGAAILRYGLPESHELRAAWLFRLVLDNGWSVDFSSACTAIGDWQEIGSLNLSFAHAQTASDPIRWVTHPVTDFRVLSATKLVYEDPGVYTECGIELTDMKNRVIVVAAATSPGSVSIFAPFSREKFEPEFAIERLQPHRL